MPSFDQTPDKPKSFGYKVSWFAVKASDPASVLDALEFMEATQANWASGFVAAYQYGSTSQGTDAWVFVSPPVNGWVLVVGSSLPYPAASIEALHDVGRRAAREALAEIGRKFDVLFSRLMKRFADVQFFGTHRVSGFVAWARALKGEPTRIFSYADGEVYANVGEQTPEEAKLKFADLTGLSPSGARDRLFKIEEQYEAEEDALVAGGYRQVKRWRNFCKTAVQPLVNRMSSSLQLCGASIPGGYQIKSIDWAWDLPHVCRGA